LHELFARLAREFETALVVVTHNRLLAARADRVLSLDDGRLVPLAGVESMP
jgi:predicted ABC-type transport system involved in lysophospholipase L1 biosynthesis ATPase subunit